MSRFKEIEKNIVAYNGKESPFFYELKEEYYSKITDVRPSCGSCTKAWSTKTGVSAIYTGHISSNSVVEESIGTRRISVTFQDGVTEILLFDGILKK